MIKLLITGKNSFVGTEVEKFLLEANENFSITTLDMKNDLWKVFDFTQFNVVFHVAGIAHVSTKKNMESLYYKVNRDLTLEVAKKAKESGVNHFIYMSSMIVYSSKEKSITNNTNPKPDNFYGKSKLEAEMGLNKMRTDKFKVAVLRPPMIYGHNSKGNFIKLMKLSKKMIIFPNFPNKKSILYIKNLAELIRIIIQDKLEGTFLARNIEAVSTYDILNLSKEIYFGKKIYPIRLINPLISIMIRLSKYVNKIFGDFYYSIDIDNQINYNKYNLQDSLLDMKKQDEKNIHQ